ncbi:hypothetical protein FHS90_001677 [Rufibacter quisquiliarum]|uniref:Uncharacterized protein n=1 Tax=Rufibacter quisquiliarum TaxID=1549639 RepID=A0A839GJL9_9BACT|nr:hypothetical protein [Rufibacter quisquiliarum]
MHILKPLPTLNRSAINISTFLLINILHSETPKEA